MTNTGRSSPAPQPSPRASAAALFSSSPGGGSLRPRSYGTSVPRSDTTARLSQPVLSSSHNLGTSPASTGGLRGSAVAPGGSGRWSPSGELSPLAGGGTGSLNPAGPGVSALAMALSNSFGTSPPRFGTPPVRAASPAHGAGAAPQRSPSLTPGGSAGGGSGSHGGLGSGAALTPTNYGSFESRPRYASASGAYEDPEIVRRHLVQRTDAASMSDKTSDAKGKQPAGNTGEGGGGGGSNIGGGGGDADSSTGDVGATGINDDEFSSLQLQGGDITRPIYKWTEEATNKVHRSKSFSMPRPEPESEVLDISTIKVPGGFRRNYLRRAVKKSGADGYGSFDDPENPQHHYHHHHHLHHHAGEQQQPQQQQQQQQHLFTSSFLEFLSIYGHFAGEELEEDDEVLKPGEYFSSGEDELSAEGGGAYGVRGVSDAGSDLSGSSSDEDHEPMEDSTLLTPSRRRRRRKTRGGSGKASPMGAAAVLLKSFVGTGVLFLPRAYLSGGMLFSNLVLLFVAALSYYCFVLLVTTRLRVEGSFGDIGGILYGKWLRFLILTSIVISQIGFVAAYIVFTSENLQAVLLAVSDCTRLVPIKYLILLQMLVFFPFSLLRDINKLGVTALVADAFIVVGLAYLFYFDVHTLATEGLADITLFNPNSWTLFIGTAIFTFEGIGLIIPIQESMRHPEKFPKVMFAVMIIITTIFVTMGAVSYAAYGSKTETVVLLNLPQGNRMVNGVQFLYSLAIMLSTPLQIFPAIRITENGLFTRSGKYNPYIKWQKNGFRFFVVAACAAIAWGGADNLDKFVALVGNFACIPLVYIYPPMLHYRAVARSRLWKASDVALCIFGFVAMAYTTSLTILSWANASTEPALPSYCDSR
ncbi:amino acid transporter [Niveomyces insectorum RCEF 264]|uniref:Amino acid transporter n=1 Tax=Niveomyces insectorum RCEF 264 TaxID=1081102 RepID=A0A167MFQ0_9HYPO|nr:amino acid transporter [Niveomyces insectorum RCEF 264]